MDIVRSATSVLETSLKILNELKKLYGQNDEATKGVSSILRDLEYIEKEIKKKESSGTLDHSWLKDLRHIKLRIEGAVDFYTINKSQLKGRCDGLAGKVADKLIDNVHGPRSALIGYLEDIQNLTAAAKNRAETFGPGNDGKTETTRKEQEAFYHDPVGEPVGLEKSIKDVVQMLRDMTLLKVVAISSQCTSSGSTLARAAYDEVIKSKEEEFSCKAWVTASRDDNDDDGNGLIKGILDELDQKPQGDLKDTLKDFLKNKRYIIGIGGLETTSTRYWDAVLSAFPAGNMSSRIIITTGKDEIQNCDKKCPIIYKARAHTSFEGVEAELVQNLCEGTERKTRVVTIYGPGGSGKSILAETANDQIQAEEKFLYKAPVMSSHVDRDGFLLDILRQLGDTDLEGKNSPELWKKLKELLSKGRYIVGIDGLETTSTRYWDSMLSAFPDDNMSSRIIITTGKDEIQNCDKKCPIIYKMRARTSFEGAQAELVQILCKGTERERRVVTIYGPGGSGKSILAKEANKKIQAEEKFLYEAWVRASHGVDKDLVKHTLHRLGGTYLEGDKKPDLFENLRKLLSNGRYIVVIDGLETDTDWNNLEYAFPDVNNSSIIIVTTTSRDVASLCAIHGPIYEMKPLDENSAKDLLISKVSTKKCPEDELSDDMIKMVLKTCEGLPLAIANFGDHMQKNSKLKSEYCELKDACISIGSQFIDKDKVEAFRGMKHVVNRSHTCLGDDAKACFLSLSIYSNNLLINDHDIVDNNPIKAKPLIRRLLAERLISPEEGVAEKCFRQLIENNFIVPLKHSISGQVKTFRVNRMMPQFINHKVLDEDYVTRIYTDQVEPQTDITRLCLHNEIESEEFPGIGDKVDLSHVRLLTFHGKANEALMNFKKYTFLQVLILEECGNMKDKHLNTICSQQMLRYLSIRDNKEVKKLPKDIVQMQWLETLDTRGTSVHQISIDVILQLTKLLHLFGEFQITAPNNNITSIESSKLQTLAGFLIDESPNFASLFLPRMRELRKVKILSRQAPPPEETKNLLKTLLTRPKKKDQEPPFHSLSIEKANSGLEIFNLDFLDGLKIELPRSLLSLKLCGEFTKLPQFVASFSVSLKELCLSDTNLGGTVLRELQKLESLQFLKLMGHHFGPGETLTFKSSWPGTEISGLAKNRQQPPWLGRLQRLCFQVETVPEIVIEKNAMKGLKSLQLLCKDLGHISGILYLDQLEEVILPSKVSGPGADELLEQVCQHSKKPKILDDDGSSWPISKLSRRCPLDGETKFDQKTPMSRTKGFNRKYGNTEESDGDGSSPQL